MKNETNEDVVLHFPIGINKEQKRNSRDDSLRRREAEHKIKIEDETLLNEYSTCCSRSGKTDKRLLMYASKFSLSILVLSFSFFQLARNSSQCDPNAGIYTSFISLVLGAWINDKVNNKVNKQDN